MSVETLVVGLLQTNCYLVWDIKTKKTLIIDPGDDADLILNRLKDLNLKPHLLIATHGHFDHVLAITELKLALHIPFLMHQKDLFLINRAAESGQYFTKVLSEPVLPPDGFLKDKQIIKLGNIKFEVIHTPGHTPGGISLYSPGFLFSGDVIFKDGLGRTDLGYASSIQLQKSIDKLLQLSPKTRIYPGHGPSLLISDISGKIV
jgi:glyoxylase-like metal-dependent hydrolase (beta-lactamase superfamily II)